MKNNIRDDYDIELEIADLEKKLRNRGGLIGHNPDLPREMHLAFLKRVYAVEIQIKDTDD